MRDFLYRIPFLLLSIGCSFVPAGVVGAYSGGLGTVGCPYLISSRADMELLSRDVNAGHSYEDTCFLLTCDLVGADDIVGTVIGVDANHYFSGIFDGGGHSVAVKIDVRDSGDLYGGVFGITRYATIKNLSVSGRVFVFSGSGDASAGGIVGDFHGTDESEISNCSNSAEIIVEAKTESYAGGIAGKFVNDIHNCHNSGRISAIGGSWTLAGDITGRFYGGEINRCRNSGKVTINGGCAGGIMGSCYVDVFEYVGELSNCSNVGDILAVGPGQITELFDRITTSYVGGIVGYDITGSGVSDSDTINSGEILDLSPVRSD
jgi:hypothetical protein